jgi:EAL domain-containing protein (putative c-di-GMP-specific phosphodiesterase class I)
MCDEVQGFYCYEPMPAEEIENILRNEQQVRVMTADIGA